MNHTCTDCHQPIPAGEAVLRSVSLEQVAFHRECYALRLPVAVPAPAVPAQRVGGTLSERIARAAR